jgi:hypothetical protein
MGMANLRRRVRALGEHFYCAIHPGQELICSRCDVLALSPEEWEELEQLLHKAGFLDRGREPYKTTGTCWRCGGEDRLACLRCLEARGEPTKLDFLDAQELDRLHELAGKRLPPWLISDL